MQTEEDGKTSSFESEVNADLIEVALLLDSLILHNPFDFERLQPPLLRREKRLDIAQLAQLPLAVFTGLMPLIDSSTRTHKHTRSVRYNNDMI